MELPPGFRFHPTDEELITHYLSKKIADCHFSAIAIGEVDINKVEPWDLPWRAKIGEKEWYFFCVKDKKYPAGSRTNRATAAGYWKATGKDKEIFRGKTLVGTKKTLVFYHGRAPRGEKSNWVAHEYNMANYSYSTQNNWVLSRVFEKTSGGKKVHISELIRMQPSTAPPYYNTKTKAESCLVPCFSSPHIPSSYSFGQLLEESFIFRGTMNHEYIKEGEMASAHKYSNLEVENISFGVQGLASASVGSLDLDTLWGY